MEIFENGNCCKWKLWKMKIVENGIVNDIKKIYPVFFQVLPRPDHFGMGFES